MKKWFKRFWFSILYIIKIIIFMVSTLSISFSSHYALLVPLRHWLKIYLWCNQVCLIDICITLKWYLNICIKHFFHLLLKIWRCFNYFLSYFLLVLHHQNSLVWKMVRGFSFNVLQWWWRVSAYRGLIMFSIKKLSFFLIYQANFFFTRRTVNQTFLEKFSQVLVNSADVGNHV